MEDFSFDNAGRLAPVCQMQETVPVEVIHRYNNLYINILYYKYFADLFVFRFFFLIFDTCKRTGS